MWAFPLPPPCKGQNVFFQPWLLLSLGIANVSINTDTPKEKEKYFGMTKEIIISRFLAVSGKFVSLHQNCQVSNHQILVF